MKCDGCLDFLSYAICKQEQMDMDFYSLYIVLFCLLAEYLSILLNLVWCIKFGWGTKKNWQLDPGVIRYQGFLNSVKLI